MIKVRKSECVKQKQKLLDLLDTWAKKDSVAYKDAMALDPEDGESWSEITNWLLEENNYQEFILCCRMAVELTSESDSSYEGYLGQLGMGLASQTGTNFIEAVQVLQKAIELDPYDFYHWFFLGFAYLGQINDTKAISCFEKALELNPEDKKAEEEWINLKMKLGASKTWLEEYNHNKELLKAEIESQKKILLDLAGPRPKDYERCILFPESIWDLDKEDSFHWEWLGNSYFKNKKYQEAIICFRIMAKLVPNNTDPWKKLGEIHIKQKNYQEAIQCYEKALEIDSEHVGLWLELADVFKEQKNLQEFSRCYEKGILCYEKALEIDPDNANTWNSLGCAYDELNRHQKAIQCYEMALEVDPDDPDKFKTAYAWFNLGSSYDKLGHLTEALKCYEKALELDPKDEDTQEELKKINMKLKLKKFKRIMKMCQEVKLMSVAQSLNITKKELFEYLIEWNEHIPFKIKADLIVVENLSDFVASLDHEFLKWEQTETQKDGKK